MKKIYIHVGMGKTGTTAIQEFCWKNRKQLQKDGICYPEIGVMSGAHHLLSPHIPPFLADNKEWNFLEVKYWVDKLKNIEEDKILISSELMAWASEEKVENFCNELKKCFDVKIIFYFRRQDDAIMSGYNQSIKAGLQKKTLEEIFDKMLKKFNYLDRIKPWLDSVGEKNVLANIYEKKIFYKLDLIKDFFYRNLNIEIEDKYTFNKSKSNERLSTKVLEFKRLINNIYDNEKDRNKFNEILRKYSQEKNVKDIDILTRLGLKRVYDYNSSINEIFDKNFGISLLETNASEEYFEEELTKQSELSKEVSKIMDYMKKIHKKNYSELIAQARQKIDNKNKLIKSAAQNILKFDNIKNKKTLYLHIGLHKTATSSIQDTLYSNYKILRKNGIMYPRNIKPNHSICLFNAFWDRDKKHRILVANNREKDEKIIIERNKKTLIKIMDEFYSNSFNKLVISGEIANNFNEKSIRELKLFFEEYSNEIDIKIIMCVRNPVSYFTSALQQVIKDDRDYDWLQEKLKTREGSFFVDKYNKYLEVFGKKNILVYSFEDSVKYKYGPVGFFLKNIGVSEDSIKYFDISKSNESLSDKSVDIISHINKCYPPYKNEKHSLLREKNDTLLLNNIRGNKFNIPIVYEDKIREHYKTEIKFIKENFEIDYFDKINRYQESNIIFDKDFYVDLTNIYEELSKTVKQGIYEYIIQKLNTEKNEESISNLLKIKKFIQEKG